MYKRHPMYQRSRSIKKKHVAATIAIEMIQKEIATPSLGLKKPCCEACFATWSNVTCFATWSNVTEFTMVEHRMKNVHSVQHSSKIWNQV